MGAPEFAEPAAETAADVFIRGLGSTDDAAWLVDSLKSSFAGGSFGETVSERLRESLGADTAYLEDQGIDVPTILDNFPILLVREIGAGEEPGHPLSGIKQSVILQEIRARLDAIAMALSGSPRDGRETIAPPPWTEALGAEVSKLLDEVQLELLRLSPAALARRGSLIEVLGEWDEGVQTRSGHQGDVRREIVPWRQIAAGISSNPTVLTITGGPGYGKTCLLEALWHDARLRYASAAQMSQPEPGRDTSRSSLIVPLIVSAPALANKARRFDAFAESVVETLMDMLSTTPSQSAKTWLRRKIEAHEILLLVDGFDEIEDPSAAANLRREISRYCRSELSQVVLTSRPEGHVPIPSAQFFILGCNEEAKRKFAMEQLGESGIVDRIIEVESEICDSAELSSPLTIAWLCAIASEKPAGLPTSRSELYEQMVYILTAAGWKSEVSVRPLSRQVPKTVADLSLLALHCAQKVGGWTQIVSPAEIHDTAPYLLETAPIAGGVLVRERNRFASRDASSAAFRFAHRTIQEYLAARALCRTSPEPNASWEQVVVERVWSPGWSNTLSFIAELVGSSGVISKLLQDEDQDRGFHQRLIVALRLLARDPSSWNALSAVISRGLQIVVQRNFIDQRNALRAILKFGEHGIRLVVAVLLSQDLDMSIRIAIVEVLAQLAGSESNADAIDTLLLFFQSDLGKLEGGEDSRAHYSAWIFLKRLGIESVGPVLARHKYPTEYEELLRSVLTLKNTDSNYLEESLWSLGMLERSIAALKRTTLFEHLAQSHVDEWVAAARHFSDLYEGFPQSDALKKGRELTISYYEAIEESLNAMPTSASAIAAIDGDAADLPTRIISTIYLSRVGNARAIPSLQRLLLEVATQEFGEFMTGIAITCLEYFPDDRSAAELRNTALERQGIWANLTVGGQRGAQQAAAELFMEKPQLFDALRLREAFINGTADERGALAGGMAYLGLAEMRIVLQSAAGVGPYGRIAIVHALAVANVCLLVGDDLLPSILAMIEESLLEDGPSAAIYYLLYAVWPIARGCYELSRDATRWAEFKALMDLATEGVGKGSSDDS